jgi:hypothetical protein
MDRSRKIKKSIRKLAKKIFAAAIVADIVLLPICSGLVCAIQYRDIYSPISFSIIAMFSIISYASLYIYIFYDGSYKKEHNVFTLMLCTNMVTFTAVSSML